MSPWSTWACACRLRRSWLLDCMAKHHGICNVAMTQRNTDWLLNACSASNRSSQHILLTLEAFEKVYVAEWMPPPNYLQSKKTMKLALPFGGQWKALCWHWHCNKCMGHSSWNSAYPFPQRTPGLREFPTKLQKSPLPTQAQPYRKRSRRRVYTPFRCDRSLEIYPTTSPSMTKQEPS